MLKLQDSSTTDECTDTLDSTALDSTALDSTAVDSTAVESTPVVIVQDSDHSDTDESLPDTHPVLNSFQSDDDGVSERQFKSKSAL